MSKLPYLCFINSRNSGNSIVPLPSRSASIIKFRTSSSKQARSDNLAHFLAAKAQLNTCTCVSVCPSVWQTEFLPVYTPLYPLMPLYAPLCAFTPLYTSLEAFTCFYTLYKLSSSQDLVVGLVINNMITHNFFRSVRLYVHMPINHHTRI